MPGDYLIVKGVGKTLRKQLVKYLESEGKECKGLLDLPSKEDESRTISFLPKEVIANLGRYPSAGSVFGVRVEPLLRTIQDKRFGEIRIYQKFKDDQLDRLMAEIKTFYSIIKEQGHNKIPYHLEVRNPQGKYQGYYRYLPKADQDILCIKPEANLESLQYILFHEHGHAIYNRRCNARTRNNWVKLYHSFVALTEATEEDLAAILAELQSVGHIGDYLKDAEDETKEIVRASLRYISHVHGVSKHHLDTAMSIQDSIEPYWPVTPLDFSTKDTVVSEYGRRSPEELHSEAYAFHMLDRPLPKKVDALLTATLSKLTT